MVLSLLFLLHVLLTGSFRTSAAHTPRFQMKQLDNQGFSTRFEALWMEILVEQKDSDQAVLISNSANQVPYGITKGCTLVEPNIFNDKFMFILHENMIKANINPTYIITDMNINDGNREEIIKIIRKLDKHSNIFTFWSSVPIYISLNVFFISPNMQGPQLYSIYETCAYCDNGKHSIKLNNLWSPNSGFKERLSLLSSFKGSLYNATLAVGCVNSPAVIFRIGTDKSGKTIWSGYMVEMLALLGKRMEFHLDFTGMHFDEILKLVSIEKVDIGAGYYYPTWDRYKFVDFSASYEFSENVIVTDKPPRSLDFFAFLQPFPALVWFIIIFSVPAVAGALYVVNRFSPDHGQSLHFSECLWQVASVILWDTTNLKSPSPGTIILLLSYLLSCFIIITLFTSECTSLMTNEPYKYPPIDSMEHFIQHDLKWLGHDSDAITVSLKNSSALMRSRHVHQGDSSISYIGLAYVIKTLNMMLEEPRTYIYPHDRLSVMFILDLYYRDMAREHKFYISNKPFGSSGLVIFLQKHTSYQDTFNMHIMQLQQFGIVSKLGGDAVEPYKKMGRDKAKAENRLPEPKPRNTIQLKHMLGSLVFYATGLVLAFLAFLEEHIHFHLWVLGPGSRRY